MFKLRFFLLCVTVDLLKLLFLQCWEIFIREDLFKNDFRSYSLPIETNIFLNIKWFNKPILFFILPSNVDIRRKEYSLYSSKRFKMRGDLLYKKCYLLFKIGIITLKI